MQCVIQFIKDSSVCYNIINKVFIVWQIDANFPPCITKCPCPLFRFSLSWALITIKLLTGFTNLTTLDTSCKWNHVIFVLLCSYFMCLFFSGSPLLLYMAWLFLLKQSCIALYVFIICSLSTYLNLHIYCFNTLVIMNIDAMSVEVQICFQDPVCYYF